MQHGRRRWPGAWECRRIEAMKTDSRNPLNLGLAEGVRRMGFRKWYERELLSSHAHMLLALLSTIGLIGTLEAFSSSGPEEKLLNVALFLISGAIGLWALRRYLYLLMHAEEVANQANCPHCGTYARFELLGENRLDSQIEVRCRKCASQWHINF